jgi:hypothetical protein
VHADAAAPQTQEPLPPALREALHELAFAFAALAEAGDTDAAQAAAHATRARCLAAGPAEAGGLPAQFVGKLIEGCADDTLRLTGSGRRDAAEPAVPRRQRA